MYFEGFLYILKQNNIFDRTWAFNLFLTNYILPSLTCLLESIFHTMGKITHYLLAKINKSTINIKKDEKLRKTKL